MDEILEKMCGMENIEQVLPPIEVISERAYLEFTVKEKGKKRERKMPVLLSRCPFCGEPYDEKKKS
jgi:hypothetical protein